jgi:hypothetical protein
MNRACASIHPGGHTLGVTTVVTRGDLNGRKPMGPRRNAALFPPGLSNTTANEWVAVPGRWAIAAEGMR